MHELSITESILEIALRHAELANADRITRIHLAIGQLASIVDDSLQFYWDIISSGSQAEGAILSFRRIQTRFQCKPCGLIFTPTDTDYSCPDCGSFDILVVSGQEFYVEAIDIEKSSSNEKIKSNL